MAIKVCDRGHVTGTKSCWCGAKAYGAKVIVRMTDDEKPAPKSVMKRIISYFRYRRGKAPKRVGRVA